MWRFVDENLNIVWWHKEGTDVCQAITGKELPLWKGTDGRWHVIRNLGQEMGLLEHRNFRTTQALYEQFPFYRS